MAKRALINLGWLSALLASVAFLALPATTRSAQFPCRWNWGLNAGLPAGFVVAGINADCFGRAGSLTLGIRLLKFNPKSRRWHTDKVKDKTFTDMKGNRGIDVTERCRFQKLRAIYRWTLRDPGGGIVATKVVRTRAWQAPGPGCTIILK